MSKAASARAGSVPKSAARRVLFARVGSMTFYNGPQPGDERPLGGGRYNRKNVGHELFNFSNFGGRLYGFVRTKNKQIRLERIDPSAPADSLEDVLVVFVAKQHIVGWYRNATVHRSRLRIPRSVTGQIRRRTQRAGMKNFKMEECVFEASPDEATLLPPDERTCRVPGNVKGGFGESNIRYRRAPDGKDDEASWMRKAVDYVLNYDKENLLRNPYAHINSETSAAIAEERAAGFQSDVAIRQGVEDYAMGVARKALEKRGYGDFANTSSSKPYDYTCTKLGRLFYVEVKGTQTVGKSIFLTKNEVSHADQHPNSSVLVLVSSVNVSGRKKVSVSGGTVAVWENWQPQKGDLTAIQYAWAVN